MTQKEQPAQPEPLEQKCGRLLRRLWPVWIAAAVAFLLLGLYCIVRPVWESPQNHYTAVAYFEYSFNPYALTYLAGALLALCVVQYLNLRDGMDAEKRQLYQRPRRLLGLWAVALLLGLLGAFLLAVLQIRLGVGYIGGRDVQGLMFARSATSSLVSLMGAMIFPPLPFYLLSRAVPGLRRGLRRDLDDIMIGIYSMLAFIKLGCHANGCCYYVHTNFLFLGSSRFPGQLAESLLLFIVAGLLAGYRRKAKKPVEGALYPAGMMLYLPCFFILDFFKDYKANDYPFGGPLSFWQWLGILMFAAGAVWLALVLRRQKREEASVVSANSAIT